MGPGLREIYYRPLEEIDTVEFGQVVAVVNPVLASLDLDIKALKVTIANVKLGATKSILRETKKRLQTLQRLIGTGIKGVVSDADIGDAEVSVAKYDGERMEEEQNILTAQKEWDQAVWIRDNHFLTSDVRGQSRIKKIYKKEGESIKRKTPVPSCNCGASAV